MSTLELFEGRLSVSEIMTMDYSFLRAMIRAKERQLQAKIKVQKDMERQAQMKK